MSNDEAPILWPPDVEKGWRQEENGMTEDKMVGWHHQLNRHEFEQAPGVGDGQASLVCCSPWGHKELDMTEWLNWTDPQEDTRTSWKLSRERQFLNCPTGLATDGSLVLGSLAWPFWDICLHCLWKLSLSLVLWQAECLPVFPLFWIHVSR